MIAKGRDLRNILDEVASLADSILTSGFRSDFSVSRKQGDEIVTSVDKAVHDAAYKFLVKAGFAAASIVSEESEAGTEAAEYWLIDPLDGTREFASGIPEFAFSAAYIVNGRVEAAVVSSPLQGIRVLGTRENGIECESKMQKESSWVHASESLIVSRSEFQEGLFENFEAGREILPIGSVALKFALVAAGLAHSVLSLRPKSPWDIAGGVWLVEIAGGLARDLKGRAFSFAEARKRHSDGLIAVHRPEGDTDALRSAALLRMQERPFTEKARG